MGDWAHNVYCLDAATGAEKWIYTTQAHVNSSPAVANGLVYVGSWIMRFTLLESYPLRQAI